MIESLLHDNQDHLNTKSGLELLMTKIDNKLPAVEILIKTNLNLMGQFLEKLDEIVGIMKETNIELA